MWSPALVATALLLTVPFTGQPRQRDAADDLSTIGPSVFISPTGNDANRCTAASPCQSLNRAYRIANPGRVVQVGGGSYGAQTIDDDPSKDRRGLADVVFRPAPGATARFPNVTISARHIVFAGTGTGNGFTLRAWTAASGASNITFRDVNTQIFNILSASHISIIGGQVGPWDSSPAGEDSQVKAQSGTAPPPTDILISGVYFHDITKNVYSDYHTDCLQFGSGQHVVIRNNTFTRCADADLFVRSWGRGPSDQLRNFVIEHNVFGPTLRGYFDLQLSDSEVGGDFCDSFVFRYNVVIGQQLYFRCGPPAGSQGQGLLYANILPRVDVWVCGQNTTTGNQPTYSFNVYTDVTSARCHSSEAIGRPIVIARTGTARTGRPLRLFYTLVAPGGTAVQLRVYGRQKVLSTITGRAPSTPGPRSVSFPASWRTKATRFCVTAGTAPSVAASCARITKA
jgi:hypothetical protein